MPTTTLDDLPRVMAELETKIRTAVLFACWHWADEATVVRKVTPGMLGGGLKRKWEAERLADGANLRNKSRFIGLLEKGSGPLGKVDARTRRGIGAWVIKRIGKGPWSREYLDEQIALAVSTIENQGIRPQYFIRSNMPAIMRSLQKEIVASLRNEVKPPQFAGPVQQMGGSGD